MFNFQPIRLLDQDCCYKFTYLIINSADPDKLASSDLFIHDLFDLQTFEIKFIAYHWYLIIVYPDQTPNGSV